MFPIAIEVLSRVPFCPLKQAYQITSLLLKQTGLGFYLTKDSSKLHSYIVS